MRLRRLQRNWELLARNDPLWAVLTAPEFRGGDGDVAEFFEQGRSTVAGVLSHLDDLGLAPARGRALDFGCGVGRLTQALADHFERCDGVDIAPAMLEKARSHNRHGDRCTYHLNVVDDLCLFDDASFDLVVSALVLQHMEPRHATRYLAEFVRVLRPGGALFVQVPVERVADVGDGRPPPIEDAPRAQLTAAATSLALPAGARLPLEVTVRNTGGATWVRMGTVRLGNHWLGVDGSLLVNDDGRADLRTSVAPGEEVTMTVVVTAPRRPGDYLLELDMVQEDVAWFAERASPTLRIPAKVRPARAAAVRRLLRPRRRGEHRPEPLMEMHCVPREEVVAVLEAAGARVAEVTLNSACGPGFVSCNFVAVRAARTTEAQAAGAASG
jgi:SAM-dependent methyltransferase